VEVAKPFLIAVGAKLWHLGVLVGLVAILNGQTSGYEWFELPRYAAVILFLAFVLMAIWVFVTYSRRTETALYPSQWFVLAALFWFPWILSTAVLLLQVFPVRGVVQAAVAWWFAGNLLNVWLTLAGLAATFYLCRNSRSAVAKSLPRAVRVLDRVALWFLDGHSDAFPAACLDEHIEQRGDGHDDHSGLQRLFPSCSIPVAAPKLPVVVGRCAIPSSARGVWCWRHWLPPSRPVRRSRG
jgi:hypothetical protein